VGGTRLLSLNDAPTLAAFALLRRLAIGASRRRPCHPHPEPLARPIMRLEPTVPLARKRAAGPPAQSATAFCL